MQAEQALVDVYLALGSNLGRRAEDLCAAADRLVAGGGIGLSIRSSIYETSPVGGPPDQDDYLNAVIGVRTALGPRQILERCLAVEQELGRRRSVPDGPRTIDLDILLVGQSVIATDRLEIPHPRLHLRRFVLEPLVEIAPKLLHPVLGVSIRELLDKLPPADVRVVRVAETDWV